MSTQNKTNHPEIEQVVVFTIDDLKYGFPLHAVIRVIHAIEVRPLANTPEIIIGIINVEGNIIPVADIRKRLSLPEVEINPDDRIIIVNTGRRQIAMIVNSVTEIRTIEKGQFSDFSDSIPSSSLLQGVVKVDGELIVIYDIEKFLSLEEEDALGKAMEKTKK